MINYIIPLIGQFLSSGLWPYAFIPILILAFIACIPVIFRYLFGLRS